REGNGITKSELFANMRDVKPDEVMEELDNLVRLDLLVQYDSGPKTFLKSSTLPATFRYQITPLGRKVAASPAIEDLVVEEWLAGHGGRLIWAPSPSLQSTVSAR